MKTHLEIPNLNLDEAGGDVYRWDVAVTTAAAALGIVEVEEYEGCQGHRWRLKNPENHKIIGAASEGFHDREECRENFRRIYRAVGGQKAIKWVEVES
jgi:hypothetical protein